MRDEMESITAAEEPPSQDVPINSNLPHGTPELTVNLPTESRDSVLQCNNNGGKSDFDYYIKLPLLIISTVCAALQSTLSITRDNDYIGYIGYIPRIVFFEFTFLNAYIILNYPWWQRLRKPVKVVYGITGCILYLVAGAIVTFYRNKSSDVDDFVMPDAVEHLPQWNTQARKDPIGTTSSIGFLALLEAALHLLDIKFGTK